MPYGTSEQECLGSKQSSGSHSARMSRVLAVLDGVHLSAYSLILKWKCKLHCC